MSDQGGTDDMLNDKDDDERDMLTIHYDYETGEVTRIEDHILYTQSIAARTMDLYQDALHMLGDRWLRLFCYGDSRNDQSVVKTLTLRVRVERHYRDFTNLLDGYLPLSRGNKQVKRRKAVRKK